MYHNFFLGFLFPYKALHSAHCNHRMENVANQGNNGISKINLLVCFILTPHPKVQSPTTFKLTLLWMPPAPLTIQASVIGLKPGISRCSSISLTYF